MAAWRTVRIEIVEGNTIELKYAEFGKGRAKLRKWEIFRNGVKAGYAVNERDADVNFNRVLQGYMLNPETGKYEAVGE